MRGLEGLVVLGEGPFRHLVQGEEAAYSLGLHDEGLHSFAWGGIGLEVRHIGAGPLGAVPPDHLAVRVPGLAGGVAGGAVVQDPPVGGPGERPVDGVAEAGGVGVVPPGHHVALLGVGARKEPAAAGGRAVVPELSVAIQLVTLLHDDLGRVFGVGQVFQGLAVVLLRQFLRRGGVGNFVGPGELQDRIGEGAPFLLVQLPQFEKDAGNDFRVGLSIPRRFSPLPVPLQPASGVGEGAVLFGEAGGGEADDFGLDFGGLHVVEFAVVFPEARGFRSQGVDHHQVFQLGQSANQLGLVGDRCQGVKPLADVTVHLALVRQLELPQDVVLHIQLGQPVKAPIVLPGRTVAPPGLHQADVELGIVRPVVELVRTKGFWRTFVQVGVVVGLLFVSKCQVARQQVG